MDLLGAGTVSDGRYPLTVMLLTAGKSLPVSSSMIESEVYHPLILLIIIMASKYRKKFNLP
jgi:hypothetical protein